MKQFLPIIGYVLAAILAVFLFRQCQKENTTSGNVGVSSEQLKTLELKNGQLASEKRAYEVTIQEMRKQMWVKDDSLKVLLDLYKNPGVVYRIKTVTQIDTVRIPFTVPVEVAFNRDFDERTSNYRIAGSVNQNGLNFNSIEIPNTQRIVTGVKRGWFNTDVTTTVTNSNPLIKTTEIETQKQTIRNKRLGLGVFAGVNIKLEPVYGAGINYNLIEF